MVLIDVLFIFLVALLFSAILVGAFTWRHPAQNSAWIALLFLFAIFFLAAFAGGLWIGPIGPTLLGGYWLPYLIVGLAIALLLLAAGSFPVDPRSARREPVNLQAQTDLEEEADATTAFGIFFWILFVVLIVAIVVALVV
jgi:hypothetical protein